MYGAATPGLIVYLKLMSDVGWIIEILCDSEIMNKQGPLALARASEIAQIK